MSYHLIIIVADRNISNICSCQLTLLSNKPQMLVQSNFKYLIYSFDSLENVLEAQLDACLTGDQKGAGLTLPLWQHSFMEI